MKKKWYKRIFAGILALALTATSFSGDIENLVKAADFTSTMMNLYQDSPIYGMYISDADYKNPSKVQIKLYNGSEDDQSVIWSFSALQNGSNKIPFSAGNTTVIQSDSSETISIDIPSTAGLSLATGEYLQMEFNVSNSIHGISYYVTDENESFLVTAPTGSDIGKYDVSPFSPSTLNLFVGDSVTIEPGINKPYDRAGCFSYSSDSAAVSVDTDGKITAASYGTAHITVSSTSSQSTPASLTVNVMSLVQDPAGSFTYDGTDKTPAYKLNGTTPVYIDWKDGKATHIDAGTYYGTYTSDAGTTKEVSFTIDRKSITGTTVTTNNIKINNSTGVVTGTATLSSGDVVTIDKDVYASPVGSPTTELNPMGLPAGLYTKYVLKLTGIGNYTGKIDTVNTYVKADSLDPGSLISIEGKIVATVTQGDVSDYIYNGTNILPGVTSASPAITAIPGDLAVTFNGVGLTKGTYNEATNKLPLIDSNSITVAYASFADSKNAGTASVVVEGNPEAGYIGTVIEEYPIYQLSVRDCVVTVTPDQYEYDPAVNPEPTVTVTYNGKVIPAVSEGTVNYIVSYEDNDAIGTAEAKVTGKNNLTGKKSAYFDINGTIAGATVLVNNVTNYETTYTGKEIKPNVTVFFGNNPSQNLLRKGSNYNVSYSNNINAGTATITITGAGQYATAAGGKNQQTVTFKINPAQLPQNLTVTEADRFFKNEAWTIPTTEYNLTTNDGVDLVKGVDYGSPTYENNINAGTAAKITVQGMGNYTGSASANFEIKPLDLTGWVGTSRLQLEVDDQRYTGAALRPTVNVFLYPTTAAGDAKTPGYELPLSNFVSPLTYTSNVNVGTATVKLIGTGENVKGTITTTFNILGKTFTDCNVTMGGMPVIFPFNGDPNSGYCEYKAEYTGVNRAGTVTVKDGATTVPRQLILSDSVDVKPSAYGNYVTVKAYPSGNYAGSDIKIYFTITPRDIKKTDITFTQGTSELSGGRWYPTFTSVVDTPAGTLNRYNLVKGTDYFINVPSTATTPGTYTAEIHGMNNYGNGSDNTPRLVEYTVGQDIGDLVIKLYPASTSGSAYTDTNADGVIDTDYLGQKPAFKVFKGGVEITDLSEFVITWSNDTNFNADDSNRTLTIEPTATSTHYYGEKTIEYKINPVNLGVLHASKVLQLVDGAGSTYNDLTNTLSITYDGERHYCRNFVLNRLASQGGAVLAPLAPTDIEYDTAFIGPDKTVTARDLEVRGIGGNYTGTAKFKIEIVPKDIASSSISISGEYDSGVTYTGSQLKPQIVVKDGSKVLSFGTDYTIEYGANVDAGTAAGSYTVKGTGNYSGEKTKTFNINKMNASDFRVTFNTTSILYDGNEKKPGYSVYYQNKLLTKGADYTEAWGDNINPSELAQLTITGAGKYEGSQTFNFTIKADLGDRGMTGDPSDDYVYEATTYLNSITVLPTDGIDQIVSKMMNPDAFLAFRAPVASSDHSKDGTPLIYGTDYEASIDEMAPGVRHISFVGKGCYTGTREVEVTLKASLSDAVVTDNKPIEYYTGGVITHTPQIEVKWGEASLSEGTDYTVVYSGDSKSAGNQGYKIEPSAMATTYLTGAKTGLHYDIFYNLNEMTVTLTLPQKTDVQTGQDYYYSVYTGSAIDAAPKLFLGGNEVTSIILSQNYSINYNPTAHTNPGRVNVTLIPYTGGAGANYTVGSAGAYFMIEGIDLGHLNILSGGTAVYNGEPQVPSVEVVAGSVISSANYDLVFYDENNNEISESQCVDAGIYYVAARGKGGYAGETPKKRFEITPYDIGNHYKPGPSYNIGDISAMVSESSVVYDGNPKEPEIAVDYHTSASGTRGLVKDKDYTITYSNNTNANSVVANPVDQTKAYYTIVGQGNYTGQLKKNFAIEQATISNITIENNSSAYNGRVITPTIVVKGVKDELLIEGVDYTVSSSPAVIKEKGIYDITITSTGYGNYKAGNTTKDKNNNPLIYTVRARNLDDVYIDAKINGEDSKYTSPGDVYLSDWSVESFDPAPTITVDVTDTFKDVDPSGASAVVLSSSDFVVNGPFNVSGSGDGSIGDPAKSPYIEIEALPSSEYEGTKKIFFSIGKPLSACYIKQIQPAYTAVYSGTQKKPGDSQIVVIDPATNKVVPRTGSNGGYIINWPSDMINAGTKYISVTGTGKYFGTISTDNVGVPISYTITQKDVSLSTIDVTLPGTELDAQGNYITYWTGKAIEPTVRVYDRDLRRDLVLNEDYTVEYVNNQDVTDAGVPARVKITPVPGGNYSDSQGGTLYKDFLIKPVRMNDHNIEVRWTDEGSDNNMVYWKNNTEVVPNYEVYYIDDDGRTHILNQGVGDYEVSYRYLKKDGTYAYSVTDGVVDPEFKWYAGTMELYVTGGGNYSGSVAKPYYIRANLSDMNPTPEAYIAPTTTIKPFFTGDIPVITDLSIVFASEGPLNLPTADNKIDSAPNTVVWQNDAFTITFDNDYGDGNKSGHMTITSNNSRAYTGEFEYRFDTEDSVDAIILDTYTSQYNYTGLPISLVYSLKTTGGSPVSSNISTVTYYNAGGDEVSPVAVGNYTAKIHINLAGNEKDIIVPFEIKRGDLSAANIICTDPMSYTGGVISPEIRVYLGRNRLIEGRDFTVSYGDLGHDNKTPVDWTADHSGADTGIITITGMGNFDGTASKTFEINPPSPSHLVVDNQTSNSLRVGWVRNEHVGEWIIECKPANAASAGATITKSVGPLDNFVVIDGLVPGTQYDITVYSKAVGVKGEPMFISNSSTKTTVADLTGATATVKGTTVTLGWTPVPNASGYEIIRSTDINQNYRLVASFPATFGGWTNNNLSPGTYYYKIRAYTVDSNRVVTYGGYSAPITVIVP